MWHNELCALTFVNLNVPNICGFLILYVIYQKPKASVSKNYNSPEKSRTPAKKPLIIL